MARKPTSRPDNTCLISAIRKARMTGHVNGWIQHHQRHRSSRTETSAHAGHDAMPQWRMQPRGAPGARHPITEGVANVTTPQTAQPVTRARPDSSRPATIHPTRSPPPGYPLPMPLRPTSLYRHEVAAT